MKLSAAPAAGALDGSELVPIVQGGATKQTTVADLITGGSTLLLLSGNGAPDVDAGNNGDFYIDKAAWEIYGPKAAGAWPAGVSMIGSGEDGEDGDSAYTVAVANGFVGDSAAWLASLKGDPGDDAANPNFTYAIETLDPGEDATIAAAGAYPNITLTFGIPKGDQGEPGEDGEDGEGAATFAALTGAPGDNAALAATLGLKAPLISPAFTGAPTAPTAADGTNTTQIASTAFVHSGLAAKPDAADVNAALALKAPLASPALTGEPTAPTAADGTNTIQIASTAFVHSGLAAKADTADVTAALALKAPLANPALTGTPTAPTAAPGANSTQIASTAYVDSAVGAVGAGYAALAGSTFTGKVTLKASIAGGAYLNIPQGVAVTAPGNGDFWTTAAGLFGRINGTTLQFAPLADPAFTGAPTAPTAAAATSSVQIATTAYVQGEKQLTATASRTGYTLAASDAFRRVPATGRVTVPNNATAAIPIDSITFVHNTTSGTIPITQGAGCTLTKEADGTTGSGTLAAHRVLGLLKTDTNAFLAIGAGFE